MNFEDPGFFQFSVFFWRGYFPKIKCFSTFQVHVLKRLKLFRTILTFSIICNSSHLPLTHGNLRYVSLEKISYWRGYQKKSPCAESKVINKNKDSTCFEKALKIPSRKTTKNNKATEQQNHTHTHTTKQHTAKQRTTKNAEQRTKQRITNHKHHRKNDKQQTIPHTHHTHTHAP